MAKKARKTGKRCLALFMTVLMLMSAWVFVAPTKADAASAGNYYVKITGAMEGWKFTFVSASNLNNTFTAGWDGTTNDSAGMVIRYKGNNGTNTSTADKTVDLHGWGNPMPTNKQDRSTNTTVPGFPTGFYFCLDQNDAAGGTKLYITKIEVGSSASNLTTIFSGEIKLDSTNGTKKAFIYVDGTSSTSSNASVSGNSGWTMPYANSMSSGAAISGATELTIPKTGASNLTSNYTYSGTVKDQYGVDWYEDLVFYLASSEPQSVNGVSDSFDTGKASIGSSGTLTLRPACQIAGTTNSVYAWVCAKRGNAWLKMRVKFVDPKYTVKFYDGDGNQFGNTQQVYYGDNATNPGTPTKSYTSSVHYTFSAWDDYTNIVADRNVNASFDSAAHTYGSWSADTATCTAGGSHSRTCSVCSYKQTESTSALGHNWVTTVNANHLKSAATCTSPAIYYKWCSRCGANHPTDTFTNGSALGHDFSANASRIHSLNNGTHNWKCSRCDAYGKVDNGTQVENGTVGCTYGDWTTDTATCTDGGSKSHTCSVCSYTETQNTSALGHNMTAHPANPATCEGDGNSAYWSCSRCGKYFSDAQGNNVINENDWVIEAIGHDWGDWTSISATQHKRVCGNDANHTQIADHSMSKASTVAPTCTAKGYDLYTCSVCGYEEHRNEVAAKGHDYTGDVHDNNDGTHSWACKNNCGTYGKVVNNEQIENGSVVCTYGEWTNDTATCEVAGTRTHSCDVCGHPVTETSPAKGHDWDEPDYDWVRDGDQYNVTATRVCKRDNDHTETETKRSTSAVTADPTCEAAGSTRFTVVFDNTAFGTQTKDMPEPGSTGHAWGAWTSISDTQHRRVCGNDANHTETGNHALAYQSTKQPTCTEGGYDIWTCSVCGYEEHRNNTPANGHRWNEGTVTKPATCEETGIRTRTCLDCGATDDVTIPVDSTNHTHLEAVDAVANTCEHAGNIAYWYCSGCRQYYGNAAGTDEITQASTVLAQKQHDYSGACRHIDGTNTHEFQCVNGCGQYGGTAECNYGEWTEDTATCTAGGTHSHTCPTCHYTDTQATPALGHIMTVHPANAAKCEEDGNTAYWSCSRCGKYFSDENGNTEIAENSWVLPQIGHAWGAWTDDHNGTSHTRVCGNDANHTETESHDMQLIETIAPTCEAIGYEVWTCSVCGYSEHREEQAALGHDFIGDVRDNDNGTHSFKCTHEGCGKYGVGTGASAEVNGTETCQYGAWSEDTATCLVGGSHTKVCGVCNHPVTEATPPLGHDFTEAVPSDATMYLDANCTDSALYFYTCSRCHISEGNAAHVYASGDPLGHDWETEPPEYVWKDNNTHMTATLYCGRAKAHYITEDATVTKVVTKQPTCTEKGVATYTATFANDPTQNEYNYTTPFTTQTTTSDVDKLPHTMGTPVEAVNPTCIAAGHIQYWVCTECGGYFEDEGGYYPTTAEGVVLPIDPDAHNWGDWTPDGETGHKRVCANDPTNHIDTQDHEWAQVPDARYLVAGSGCLTPAEYYESCSVCGYVSTTRTFTYGAPAGHTLVEVPAVAATCVTSGNIHYWKCAVCDRYFNNSDGANEHEILDKTSVVTEGGHQFPLIHHAATAATCVTAGNSEYWECEVCGKYFSDAAGTQQITNKNDVIIQPSGHDWNPETITYVWSDDYSKVTATMKCRNDESHVMVRVSNTTAEATNANCTTPGTTTYTAVFTEPFATQTKAVNNIASLGHMLIKTPAKAATCMETGNIEYWTCSRCSKVFTDGTAQSEITDLSTLTIPIAPNNHAVLTHVPEAPATCTNDGTAEHWVCNACGHLFVYENNVLTEKTLAQLKIDAHHTLTTHVTAKAPTCLAEGNVEYWLCSACDKLFAADKTTELPTAVLSATGHSFSTVAAVGATCEEAGHEAYKKCNNCGLFFDTAATVTTTADNAIDPSDMVTDPIGHDYSARPTFVWNGHTAKATFVCQNDSSHTEEVDCVVTKTATAPHCDTPGEDVYTAHASYDGHDWTEASAPETVPATGHSFTGSVKDNGNGTHSFQCVNGCEQYGTDEDGVGGSASCEFREDGWVIGENESCLTVGTESQYCAVCGHKAERERTALGHNFTAVAAVEETCTEDGNTAYWVCTRCGEFFSSNEHPTSDADKIADKNTVVIPASGHDWGEPTFAWTGYTAATATFVCQNDESHKETVICTVSKTPGTPGCEQGATNVYTATAVFDGHSYTNVKREDISQTNHNWGTPVYVWSEDLSTCTATVTCLNDANHKKTETVNTVESISVQPTCTEEGLAVYTATFENPLFTQQKEYKTLLATGHPDESVHKYEQDPTCTEDGYEAYWKCDICGKMYDSAELNHEIVTPTVRTATGHSWGETTYTWAEDNSSVTATRICGNDGSHVETVTVNTTSAVTTPATCEGKGKTTYTATFTTPFATQTKVVENVDALGHDFSPSKDRVHDLDGDNSHHNYACANGCGAYGVGIGNAATVGGVVECAFGDWIISNNESCTEAGSEWRQCAYCSNKETHPRAALPHTEVEVEAKDATCIADGNKAYTYCSVCGTILSVGGTPETSGVKVYDAAGKELIKTTTKLGHDLTKTDAVAPTCEIAGNIDYWTCSRCGKIFNVEEPAEDTDPITLADIVDPAIGHDYSAAADRIHSLNNGTHNWACANGCGTYGVMENSIPVKNGTVACTGDPATCTQDAHCTVCGGVFTSALGHDYRLQSWTWNGVEAATANFVCSRDSSHTHQETAVITTEPATVTCTEPGKMVYFATVHFENGIYTDKKSVIVPALDHDWDFEHPVYDWDQTKQQCTVTLKCLNDGCTAEYTEIGYNETQTTAATCENAGSVVYTAHFNISEALVSPSITVTLEALGHKWGDPDWHWAEDFSSATVTLTCGRAGCGKVETVNATVTPDTVAPTCEKDGRTVYTATATLDGRTYKDTKLTTQPASGHAWPDQPAFSWTGSDAAGWTAATATFACANNAEHDQTLTCAVTHVTEDPTCEGSGKTTYTATVTFNGNTYTDQKEVTINPTGHSYEFVDFNWSYNESTKVWSATVANFKCANDPTHTATAEATVTSETVEAICEADGSITYTATATFEGNTYTDEKVVVLPMLHHNWGDATYTWVKDGDQYKVTALRVCANKPTEHQQTETVTTTSEITSSSGCETQGVRTYTATFHTPFTTQTRTEDVAVAGHMLVHTSRVESTCTAAGNIEYWRCSVCNKIFTDEAGTAASCIGTDLAETVIPAKGHDFVMEGSGMVALDNEDGTHSFKCSRCDVYGAVIDGEQTVDGKVAHVYGEWKITKESTCTDQGDKEHVCKVCGHIETAKADLKPHEIYGISAVAPTCTVAGNIAYYYCAVCRRYFSDEAGTTVIALSETVLPALGHDFTGTVRDNGDGTHSFRCSRCGTYGAVIDGVQKPLVAGGKVAHTFDQEKQSREYVHNYANCYEPLTYYKSCVCGAKGTDTFTPEGATALGHDWLEFPEQKATCTQAGHSMYWECQRCHKQGGPENAHPYVLYPATTHGAYNIVENGASADGLIKWEACFCENKCGDYYMMNVIITSVDANGTRVPNVNVRVVNSAGKTIASGTTDGNGEVTFAKVWEDRIHPGTYDIYLEYVRDGSNYNTHGTVNFADGKVTGSFGKLTPYGGNASGSIGGKPTGEFRCSMCDLNDSMKNKPVIGWFISIIHAFVHAISRISR